MEKDERFTTFTKSFAKSIKRGKFNGHLACWATRSDEDLAYLEALFFENRWDVERVKVQHLRAMRDRADKDETQIVDFFDEYDALLADVS